MRVGEGKRSSEERGRRDGGNHGYKAKDGGRGEMMLSEDLRGVRTGRMKSGMDDGYSEEADYLQSMVMSLCYYGFGVEAGSSQTRRICASSLPPLRNPAMSSSIHSRVERQRRDEGGKDGSVV